MRIRIFALRFFAAMAALGLSAIAARAQAPGAPAPAGMSAALVKLFGKTTAFSAKGEMRLTDHAQNEVAFWPMDWALLDRKLRVEIDLAETRNRNVPPGMGNALKKIGMAEVVSIIRPDQRQVYVIYPDQRVTLRMPLPKEDYEESDSTPKIAKTPLGKETVDGHPCVKKRVTITDSTGQIVEAITWEATDLKELPIQIQTQEQDTTSLVRFKQIQFTPPAPGLFEPPSGFTLYTNSEDLKLDLSKRMMDGAAKR